MRERGVVRRWWNCGTDVLEVSRNRKYPGNAEVNSFSLSAAPSRGSRVWRRSM